MTDINRILADLRIATESTESESHVCDPSNHRCKFYAEGGYGPLQDFKAAGGTIEPGDTVHGGYYAPYRKDGENPENWQTGTVVKGDMTDADHGDVWYDIDFPNGRGYLNLARINKVTKPDGTVFDVGQMEANRQRARDAEIVRGWKNQGSATHIIESNLKITPKHIKSYSKFRSVALVDNQTNAIAREQLGPEGQAKRAEELAQGDTGQVSCRKCGKSFFNLVDKSNICSGCAGNS